MQPNGSWRTYTPDNSTPEYYSGSVMQQLTNAAGELTFIVSRRDGSKDCYGFVPQETPNGEPGAVALLSAQVDPYNHTNSFIYTDNGSTVWLNYVVDADGRTNTLNYSNPAFPAQITGVTDPFGHTASLLYNSDGLLTNLTDELGMSSAVQYDEQNWITNLTTPYGTTTFESATKADDWSDPVYGNYTLVRALRVVDPVGGTNVYMLRQDSTVVYTNATTYVPFIDGNGDAGDTYAAPLTPAQLASALEWLAPRWSPLGWGTERITDHRQVSPGRKRDLNPEQWARLFAALSGAFGRDPQ